MSSFFSICVKEVLINFNSGKKEKKMHPYLFTLDKINKKAQNITQAELEFNRLQWRTRGHRVFWVFNLHAPSPRGPSQRWPVDGSCLSGELLHGSPLQIHSHNEELSAACRMFLMALQFQCINSMDFEDSQKRMASKASALDLNCTELCVLSPLMLVGLFNPVFPGYSQIQDNHLLGELRC